MEVERVPQLMEKGVIELAPLAYMRGRTLNRSFIIVDEAQNTTPAQMKMLLTRLGSQSKMVVTGDISQTDLPPHQTSGLIIARNILRQVEGIGFVEFTRADVVRHPLVQRIIAAYDRAEL
jgi:Phosphate starvation-inducible protein PhoH, predicted ATPase